MTSLQRDLLRFIELWIHDHDGVAPSYGEMQGALGLASKASVANLVRALEDQGLIRRLPKRARSITLVGVKPVVSVTIDDRGRPRVTISAGMTAAQRESVRAALVEARL